MWITLNTLHGRESEKCLVIFNMKNVSIYYADLFQDDPKKSTMKKLNRFSLATRIDVREIQRHTVLRADGDSIILPGDRKFLERRGLCIIEGSWKSGMLLEQIKTEHSRKLPILMASNPVNYGKFNYLSSVEAVCAALYITGFRDQAEYIISKFSWGHTFLETNRELLESYSKAATLQDIEVIYGEFGFTQ